MPRKGIKAPTWQPAGPATGLRATVRNNRRGRMPIPVNRNSRSFRSIRRHPDRLVNPDNRANPVNRRIRRKQDSPVNRGSRHTPANQVNRNIQDNRRNRASPDIQDNPVSHNIRDNRLQGNTPCNRGSHNTPDSLQPDSIPCRRNTRASPNIRDSRQRDNIPCSPDNRSIQLQVSPCPIRTPVSRVIRQYRHPACQPYQDNRILMASQASQPTIRFNPPSRTKAVARSQRRAVPVSRIQRQI